MSERIRAETSVLFELIAARYERRSIMITANQPFSGWDSVFPDKAMTVAAIDRLVHHASILEHERRKLQAPHGHARSDIDQRHRKGGINHNNDAARHRSATSPLDLHGIQRGTLNPSSSTRHQRMSRTSHRQCRATLRIAMIRSLVNLDRFMSVLLVGPDSSIRWTSYRGSQQLHTLVAP